MGNNNVVVLAEGLRLCNLFNVPESRQEETMADNGDELKKWKTLYRGLAEQNERLEKKVLTQNDVMKTMRDNLENAQKAVDINKAILRTAMTEYNIKEQDYIKVLNLLKDKLREFGYVDFNSLGNEDNLRS